MIERQDTAGATRPDSTRRVRLRAAATVFATSCALAGASIASAQTPPPLPPPAGSATTIDGLISGLFRAEFYEPTDSLISPADFYRRTVDSREGIAIGVGNALSAFPLGASSAGFTYLVNPTTGESELKSVSFGPVFVERALTNGKGVFNAGFAYQAAYFDTLQGVNVKDEGFPILSQVGTYLTDNSSVGDVSRVALEMNSKVFLIAGSYGITNNFDFGFSVPVVSLSARGRYLRDYNGGLDWERDQPGGPVRTAYPNKIGTETRVDRTIDANGIGDIVLRGKYAFGPPSGQRVLIAGDLRLPTGDEENLLGAGKASVRMIVGTSVRLGESASFNANGGYTVGGLTDEINFSAGTEVAVLPSKQLTLTFDLIGQNLRDTVTAANQMTTIDRVVPAVPDPTGQVLQRRVLVQHGYWERGSTTLLRAAIGAKYAVGGNWLLTGSALFRLNDNGFQAKIVPFIGLEHTWSGR